MVFIFLMVNNAEYLLTQTWEEMPVLGPDLTRVSVSVSLGLQLISGRHAPCVASREWKYR